MFVSQVNVTEFRGIKKCKKPLELSNFTILIGRNNSGKSSLLEALSLLPTPDLYPPTHNKSRIDLLSELHGDRSSLIYGYSGSALIRCKIYGRTWRIKLHEKGSADLYVQGVEPDLLANDITRAMVKALKIKSRPHAAAIATKVFFIPYSTVFMDQLFDKLRDKSLQNSVIKSGANTRVTKELINKCVDDRYTEILFTPEMSARKELPNGNILYIKIKDLGNGIEKVVITTLLLEALKPSLILWDDFEGSAHPTLIKVLLDWLCRKKWQVILSTHSIDVLTSLLDVNPKNAKVIQLKKTAGDVLIHHDLDLAQLESLIDANSDPRILVDRLQL